MHLNGTHAKIYQKIKIVSLGTASTHREVSLQLSVSVVTGRYKAHEVTDKTSMPLELCHLVRILVELLLLTGQVFLNGMV